ncbi:hypothetical protein [Bacillus sp. FJAT-45350]|uniref:hypothetical protein n=1 Tax=Bacillus sp. FJAT-45350 TaxID=2011014 RepID=UPI000BB9008B|nr:hypothetical protein [Bacillus sp. FJAT-45350]
MFINPLQPGVALHPMLNQQPQYVYGYYQPIPYYGHGYYQPPYKPTQWVHNPLGDQLKTQPKPLSKKVATAKHSPADYHLHHGFPYGQGSGHFPDYYNSNY